VPKDLVKHKGRAWSRCLKHLHAVNPKHEIRNTKWFDLLTTLSHVEGQYSMIKIQLIQTTGDRRSCLVQQIILVTVRVST
jgi:hypothetical protein